MESNFSSYLHGQQQLGHAYSRSCSRYPQVDLSLRTRATSLEGVLTAIKVSDLNLRLSRSYSLMTAKCDSTCQKRDDEDLLLHE